VELRTLGCALVLAAAAAAGDFQLEQVQAAVKAGDYARARELLKGFPESDVDARLLLAHLDEEGLGAPADPAAAAAVYTELAKHRNGEALFRLGVLRLEGRGLKQDTRKGAAYWREAARAGHAEASYRLACLLLEQPRLKRLPDEVGVRLVAAARAGHWDAKAKFVALAWEDEVGGVDWETLGKWTEECAKHGYADAQYMLSSGFFGGSPEQQGYWLRRSAERGYAPARLELGERLCRLGGEENRAEGWEMLRGLAAEGDPEAAEALSSEAEERCERYAWYAVYVRMGEELGLWKRRELKDRQGTRDLRLLRVDEEDLPRARQLADEHWQLVADAVMKKKAAAGK